jgi:vacuolar-type H+-ATPase subunit H
MENHILREIIDVEKEIQQSIEQAKVRTREWLETRKQEIETDATRQEQSLLQTFEQARETAVHEAEKKAAEYFEQSKAQADRLTHLENDILVKIVTNHIRKIIPG